MRYRPSLRSIWTLVILGIVCYGLYLWAEQSRVEHKMPYYDQKMQAAGLMDQALRVLAEYRAETDRSESFGDPRLDMLIGQQFTTITTDFAAFEDKIAGANPNFAALIVDFLEQVGVKAGDQVAVGFTGSHPGVNLAVSAHVKCWVSNRSRSPPSVLLGGAPTIPTSRGPILKSC
jgi:poly-gamma-glutamate system protein